MTGPTLPALKYRINCNYEEISRALVARSAGFLVGSLVGGIIVERYRRLTDVWILLALLTGAAAVGAAPWCTTITMLCVDFYADGFAKGIIASGITSSSSSCIPLSGARGWLQFLQAPSGRFSSIVRFSSPVSFYSCIPHVSFHAVLPSQSRSSSSPPAFLSVCIYSLWQAISTMLSTCPAHFSSPPFATLSPLSMHLSFCCRLSSPLPFAAPSCSRIPVAFAAHTVQFDRQPS